MNIRIVQVLFGFILVSSSTSASTERPFLSRLIDVTTLSYYGVYRGASLSNLGSSFQPTPAGSNSGPLSLENTLTLGYKPTPTWIVGFVGHSLYFPIGNPVGTGQNIQNLDPWFIATKSNVVNLLGYKLGLRFTAELPLVKADFLQANRLGTALTIAFINTYSVPHTRLTVGVYAYLRGYIPRADALSNVPTYRIYVAPNANYQIGPRISATLWVDYIQATRPKGTGFLGGLKNDVIDIEPGINFDITKNISFNPIINIYPSHLTIGSTALQAYITAKAF